MTSQTTILFRFALSFLSGGVAAKGRIIEFDDATGDGTRAEGFIVKQDPSAFATSHIQGKYAFGMSGPDSSSNRLVSAGVIDASAGALSNGNADSDDAGTVTSDVTGITGSYSVASRGRGTMLLDVSGGSSFVLYMVSDAEFIAMSSDALSSSHPLQSGEFQAQTLASFGDSSLNAPAVFSSVAFDPTSNGPVASVGLVTPNGTGSAHLVLDINDAGTFTAMQSTAMTYTVSPKWAHDHDRFQSLSGVVSGERKSRLLRGYRSDRFRGAIRAANRWSLQ